MCALAPEAETIQGALLSQNHRSLPWLLPLSPFSFLTSAFKSSCRSQHSFRLYFYFILVCVFVFKGEKKPTPTPAKTPVPVRMCEFTGS